MELKIRKPIFAILILILLTVLLAIAVFFSQFSILSQRTDARNQIKISGTEKMLVALETEMTAAAKKFAERTESLTNMMAYSLYPFVHGNRYLGQDIFWDGDQIDGIVVQVQNGEIIFPRDLTPLDGISAKTVLEEPILLGYTYNDNDYLISIQNIDGSFYYIDISTSVDFLGSIFETIRFEDTIREIEKTYQSAILMIIPPSSENSSFYLPGSGIEITLQSDGKMSYFISPDEFPEYQTGPEELGITPEILDEKPKTLTLDGRLYRSSFSQIEYLGQNITLIILTDMMNADSAIASEITLVTSLTLICGIMIIMWLYWHQTYVRDHELIPDQVTLYHPSRLQKFAFSAALIGMIGLFFLVICFQSISNLNREAKRNQDAMDTIMDRLSEEDSSISKFQNDEEEWALYYAERISQLTASADIMQTSNYLSEIVKWTNCEFILLFDSEGNQIASSNTLIGITLSETEELQDFSRLLTGIGTIIQDPITSAFSDKTIQYIGARVPMNEGQSYGALILAIDPENTWGTADLRIITEFLENATPDGNLCLIISKEDNRIVYSSDPTLKGEILPSLTYTPGKPEESDLDSYWIEGKRYYGPFASNDKYICYYLTENQFIQENSLRNAFIAAFGFLIISVLITRFMMKPYSVKNFKESVKMKESAHQGDMIDMESLDDLFEKTDDNESPQRLIDRWRDLVPEQKGSLFIQFFLGILMMIFIIRGFRTNVGSGQSTVNFILIGNWKHGFNLLGAAGTMIIVLGFVIFLFFKNILLRALCAVLDSKGETICRLAFSLLQYAAVIGSIYLILGFLGFNTTFQLTSVGIISLAISLGSKDLVADILAGIFIIFEGNFTVGDIIEINGFRGIVQDIGVRNTRVIGLGDNIRIISNQDVKNITNLSKMNTWLTIELTISSDQPLFEIEEMLKNELSDAAKDISNIISGPYYKGVTNIGRGFYTIMINCECSEKWIYRVRRQLNHVIIELFTEHGYKLS